MEIIHVVLGKANPARMNGVNRVVNELATQQVLAGEKVTLWGITRSTEHDYPARHYGTRLFKAFRNPFRLDPALLKALDELAGVNDGPVYAGPELLADRRRAVGAGDKGAGVIFHLHGGFIPVFYTLARELHRRNIPYVFTPHGSYNTIALQRSRWRKQVYLWLYERTLLKYARAIHCLGKSEIEGLKHCYPNDKAVLIPYGFQSSVTAPPQSDPHAFIIGFCGRLDIYTKGLDLVLEAFSRFLQDMPNAELWIIGDSEERLALQDLAADLGIDRQVTFYGSLYGPEKLNLLRRLNVFVHPSRNEGLPTAVLEAAALGIPCVVTEATNTGDSVRAYRCGQVIRHPDAADLYRALTEMHRMLLEQGMQALSVNAQTMVREAYSWKKILCHFHQLYQRA